MHTYRPYLILIVLAIAGIAVPQRAGAQYAVTPGSRVRLVDAATKAPLLTGELIRMAGDTVIISSTSAMPTVPAGTAIVLGADRQLEVSAGTRRRTLKGVGLGFLLGTAAGAAIGRATYDNPGCSGDVCFDFGPGLATFGGALLGGASGMVIGGIIGANSKYEAWRPMGQRHVRLGLATVSSGGVRLIASVDY